MELRRLGRSGLRVAPLALGGNVFGWTADQAQSFAVLDAFVAAGFNLVDTADVYSSWLPGHSGGESETVIGQWLRARGGRERVLIATKVGLQMPGGKGLGRAHILRAVEESLRRLQTDYIDLYQAHRDDPDTPLEETLAAFETLIAQGKVRVIGASNYAADRLAAALELAAPRKLPRFESLQPHYNLCERPAFEGPLQALCLREEVGVIGYFSLASGFLSGKYRSVADLSGRARGSVVKKYLDERGLGILAALDTVASRHGATPAQVALAWLMARPGVTAPIASATNVAQLEEILGAARLALDADDVALLDRASA